MTRKSTDPFFASDANYLIDNKAGIIVDAALLTQLAQANCDLIERIAIEPVTPFEIGPNRVVGLQRRPFFQR